ncbi:MAG: hypothetical protein JWN13_6907 [Betaproteobacteria bacterium]|jgi:hypothetical protein|nr:hypothetical protein [Betaproteobacteria bacterium]
MIKTALEAALEQVKYWDAEYVVAHVTGASQRAVQCKRFIEQCKLIITALDVAAKRK